MPLICVQDVSVRYNKRPILENIALNVEAGEFVALVGQTGCGKSTLLRLMLGAEQPSAGKIVVGGKVVRCPGRDRGYVPQKYSLFPDKTVLDNITFGPESAEFPLLARLRPAFFRRRRALREQAHDYLTQMSLRESDAEKYPDQLSGGMQQRVAIAQALMMKPKVLLMDEAFSALDPGTRTSMQRLIRDVWRETGTTVVFVTHNLAEAIFLGTRVVVLAKTDRDAGSRVALDLSVPDSIRLPDGYPRRDELARLTGVIEDAALGGSLELEMAEFGG
jgi:NitT/TauT family transport system ATP-binding protein